MLNAAPARRQVRARGAFASSHIEIDCPMPRHQTTAPRREAMGGLAKGLQVIRAFTRDHSALTLTEVAGIARMPAATARRCLLTLEELGYVTRRGRQFLLRPKVLELGAAYLESMDIEHLTQDAPGGACAAHRRLGGAFGARRQRHRLRGAHFGAHADAPRGARRQPLSRARDLDGPGAARGPRAGAPGRLLPHAAVRRADRFDGHRPTQAAAR